MRVYSFEKLEVYQTARKYVKQVYLITANFPDTERYALSSQLQRAAVSIVSNIAEGTTRISYKEKERFLEISYSSLMETYCQFQIATDLNYILQVQFDELKVQVDNIACRLAALKNSYTNKK